MGATTLMFVAFFVALAQHPQRPDYANAYKDSRLEIHEGLRPLTGLSEKEDNDGKDIDGKRFESGR